MAGIHPPLQRTTSPPSSNPVSSSNLALGPGTVAISKSTHFGTLCGFNCSDQIAVPIAVASEDDFDEENKPADNVESYWGYTWPQDYNINQVTYTTGNMFPDGGWFSGNPRVQVRQNFEWIDVNGATISPAYPYSNQAGSQSVYTFTFPPTWGDGVRIIGVPGGTSYFTSMHGLAAYFADNASVGSAGFSVNIDPSSLSLTSNSTRAVSVIITPVNGFNQSVSFACSGLPVNVTCTFSPTTVTPNGRAASSTTLTITNAAVGNSAIRKAYAMPLRLGASVIASLLFIPTKRKYYGRLLGLLLLAVAVSLECSACSTDPNASGSQHPTQTSIVTITATSGSVGNALIQNVELTLITE